MPASTNPFFVQTQKSPGIAPRGITPATPIQPASKVHVGGTVSIAGPVEAEGANGASLALEGGNLQAIYQIMFQMLAELRLQTMLMENAGFCSPQNLSLLRSQLISEAA